MRTSLSVTLALVAATTLLTSCSIADPPAQDPVTPSSQSTSAAPPSYAPSTTEPDTRLTITLIAGNASEQSTRHLVCAGPAAVQGTDFSGGDKACQLVQESPVLLDTPPAKIGDDCQGTGNQNIADVFGQANGKPVRNSFRRDNTCNVKTWDKMAPLFGPVP